MEREIGPGYGRGVVGLDGGVDLVGERAKLRERLRVSGASEHPRGTPLERRAKSVDLPHVFGRETHDERASARLLVQQPFGPQELERLAHGTAADRELLLHL